MADKIDPFDVGALERSVNDSAGRVSAIWLSFVAFSAYLAAAASNISHRQIFLEEPIKLPTINIDLPLVASAILLPLLFVIYHVYVLLQVVLLARTAEAYNEAVDRAVPDGTDRVRVRQRLANTLFAQMFAGSPREREGVLGWLLRLMVWVTLAIAPVFVLVVFEIGFLPYHSPLVSWTHRGLIIADLLAVLYLWAGAINASRDIRWNSLRTHTIPASIAAVIIAVCCLFVTFPGEPVRAWMRYVGPLDETSGETSSCELPWIIAAVVPTGFDRLVLLGENLIDADKLAKVTKTARDNGQKPSESERTRSFVGRDLRCGRFAGSDLRAADFRLADLSGAVFRGAHLEAAIFNGANLTGASMDDAQLEDTDFSDTPRQEIRNDPARMAYVSLTGVQLQRANLAKVDLRNARLNNARLLGAELNSADLRGASLDNAKLQDAVLAGAKLQAASLRAASLQNASLQGAHLQGAALDGALFYSAKLDEASLQGANLYGTHFEGASLYRAKLHAAHVRDTSFEGAYLYDAQLQGLQNEGLRTRLGIIGRSFLWNAGRVRCDYTYVVEPNFDPVVDVAYMRALSRPIEATPEEIARFIDVTLIDVPEKSRALPEFSRENLRNLLQKQLGANVAATSDDDRKIWTGCANQSKANDDAAWQKLASDLVDFVCQSRTEQQYLALGFAHTWTRRTISDLPVAKLFVNSLLRSDRASCPAMEVFDDKARALLQKAIAGLGN